MAGVGQAFGPAAAYYRSQGFTDDGEVAVVDVGWNGRLKRSLGTLLEKSGSRPKRILGLYLCLSRRVNQRDEDELRGFVADPERPERVAFFDQYRHVFEAALSADHPTTVGFALEEGRACPVFGEPYPPATRHKITLQHATLDAFIGNIVTLGRAADRPIIPPAELAIENFIRFLRHPSPGDGLTFEGFLFVDGQAGDEMKPITRILRATDLLKATRDYGYWPESTFSASRLGAVAYVHRAIQRIRSKLRALRWNGRR